jgi:hypothetical protein
MFTASHSGAMLDVIPVGHRQSIQYAHEYTTHTNQAAAKPCDSHCTTRQLLLENASALIQQLNGRLSPALHNCIPGGTTKQKSKDVHKLSVLADRPAGDAVDELGCIRLAMGPMR